MQLKVIVVVLAALMLGACKGHMEVEASYDIGFQQPAAPPPQTIRVQVEVVGAPPQVAPTKPTPARRRQAPVVKPADDCTDPCLRFQVERPVPIGN